MYSYILKGNVVSELGFCTILYFHPHLLPASKPAAALCIRSGSSDTRFLIHESIVYTLFLLFLYTSSKESMLFPTFVIYEQAY